MLQQQCFCIMALGVKPAITCWDSRDLTINSWLHSWYCLHRAREFPIITMLATFRDTEEVRFRTTHRKFAEKRLCKYIKAHGRILNTNRDSAPSVWERRSDWQQKAHEEEQSHAGHYLKSSGLRGNTFGSFLTTEEFITRLNAVVCEDGLIHNEAQMMSKKVFYKFFY